MFDKRLKKIVDNYNSRDKLVFVSEVVGDFVDRLSDKLKVFFDILIAVRDDHAFPYAKEKCLALAKAIKLLVDDKSKFADWVNRTFCQNHGANGKFQKIC